MSRARWAAFKARARRPGRGSRGDLEGHRRRARKERSDPPRTLPRPQRPSSRRLSRPTATSSRSKAPPRCRRPPPARPGPAAIIWCCSPATTPAGATSAASSRPRTWSTRARRPWPASPPWPSTAATSSRSAAAVAARCGRGCWPATARAPPRRRRPFATSSAAASSSSCSTSCCRTRARQSARPRPAGPRAAPPHRGHQRRPLPVKADVPLHDVLAAEGAHQPLPGPLGRQNAELYLKSAAEMRRLFRATRRRTPTPPASPQSCDLDLGLGRFHFPADAVPRGETAYSLLSKPASGRRAALPAGHPEAGAAPARARASSSSWASPSTSWWCTTSSTSPAARGIRCSGRGSAGDSHRELRAGHHRRRPDRARPALRALPQPRPPPDARHRRRLRLRAPRRGHRLHLQALRPRARGDGGHRQHDDARAARAHRRRAFGFAPDEINAPLAATCPWGSAARSARCWPSAPSAPTTSSSTRTTAGCCDLAEQLDGCPMHLGTHLGGFIITRDPITDRVPAAVGGQGRGGARSTTRTTSRRSAWSRWTSWACGCTRRSRRRCAASRRAPASTIEPFELPPDDPEVYETASHGGHRRDVPAGELGAAQPRHAPAGARLRGHHRRHLALPPRPARGRDDRALHPPAARARAGRRAASRHGPILRRHLRRHRLPGAGASSGARPWPASTWPRPTRCAAP